MNNNIGVANCCGNNGEGLIWILILLMLFSGNGLGNGCNGNSDSFIIIIFLLLFMSGGRGLF